LILNILGVMTFNATAEDHELRGRWGWMWRRKSAMVPKIAAAHLRCKVFAGAC
jgi:hypothetical protein